MPRLIWSPQALLHLQRPNDFLKPKNPAAARRAILAIQQGVRTLSQYPEAGRPALDQPPEFREWPIPFGDGGYVALYRFDGELVVLLAVRYGRELGY